MQCYGPVAVNPLAFDESMVNIDSIAHALSNQCRFNGHTKQFYSVAQHSLIVSMLCQTEDALSGLLHDASEAYLADIPRPLKHSELFRPYLIIEKNIQRIVCAKFALPEQMPDSVREADDYALGWERRDLMTPGIEEIWSPTPYVRKTVKRLEPMAPHVAKYHFLARFEELTK